MDTETKIIRDLASALITLARWYEGDCGSVEPLDKVREYLSTFEIGREILQSYDDNNLRSIL